MISFFRISIILPFFLSFNSCGIDSENKDDKSNSEQNNKSITVTCDLARSLLNNSIVSSENDIVLTLTPTKDLKEVVEKSYSHEGKTIKVHLAGQYHENDSISSARYSMLYSIIINEQKVFNTQTVELNRTFNNSLVFGDIRDGYILDCNGV